MRIKHIFAICLAVVGLTVASCLPKTEISVPQLRITDCTNITDTSAIVRGVIISDGGSPVTEIKAVVYPGDLTFFSSQTISQGEFVIELNHLEPSTNYEVSVCATNMAGTNLGEIITFTTAESSDLSFRIPGTRMRNIAIDSLGRIYVAGSFSAKNGTSSDCFIAKLSPTGELIWRSNISTEGGDSQYGNLTIDQERGVIYLCTRRNDPYNTGGGDPYLSSYNLNDGSLNWEILLNVSASKSLLDKEGNLISVCGSAGIIKINPQGEIISGYNGPYNWNIALSGDDLIALAMLDENRKSVVGISKFQGFFQKKIWEFVSSRLNLDGDMTPMGVVNLPNDSLVIIVWITHVDEPGWIYRTYVTAYKEHANGELSLAWEHKYVALGAIVTPAGNNLLICPVVGESCAKLVTLQGETLWQDNNEVYGATYYQGKVYVVDGRDYIRVININL